MSVYHYALLEELPTGAAATVPTGWHRPFERAAARVIIPVALVASGLIWCPQPIAAAPSNTVTTLGWYQPLSKPAPTANTQLGYSFVPFNTAQINTQRIDKWLVPLSKPVPVASVVNHYSVVPLNTFQPNTATIDKWLQRLSIAPPTATAQQGNSFVPLDTAQTNTATLEKWQQPLSKAVQVATAKQGHAFAPLNTAQINTVTVEKWLQSLSRPVPAARIVQSWMFVPLDTVQPAAGLVSYDKYQQPLSVAPKSARAIYAPVSFVVLPVPQVSLVWVQPLSVAVRLPASLSAGLVYAQAPVAPTVGISGMAWLAPLGTVPYRVVYPPQQYIVAPIQLGTVVATEEPSGKWHGGYRHHDWKPWPFAKKRKIEELDELIEQLHEIAKRSPKPVSSPVILANYSRPLAEALFALDRPIADFKISRAKIAAEQLLKRQLEDDEDSAILLLLQ